MWMWSKRLGNRNCRPLQSRSSHSEATEICYRIVNLRLAGPRALRAHAARGQAELQIGYRGYIALARRSGEVSTR